MSFDERKKSRIEKLVKKFGFEMSEEPDFVICYGGDGTLLVAERIYPSIPKLCFKPKKKGKYAYELDSIERILPRIKKEKFRIKKEMKLLLKFKKFKKEALNEVQLHNEFPGRAIRFSLQVNSKSFKEVIGDGVVISTPFGSSAYYSSLGGKPFKKGIGIAFNNPHNLRIKPWRVNENSKIKIKVLREKGLILTDNDEKVFEIGVGEKFWVRKSKHYANFILV